MRSTSARNSSSRRAGLVGVIGADIEVVTDGERRTGQALEQVRIVRRQADARVIRGGGLAQHAHQPEVRDAELAQRAERAIVQVAELADAVLRERAVGFARLVRRC